MAARHVLEVIHKDDVMTPPPTAPITGSAFAATSSEMTTPKRELIAPIKRAKAGAERSTAPLLARWEAASLTDWLKARRVAQ